MQGSRSRRGGGGGLPSPVGTAPDVVREDVDKVLRVAANAQPVAPLGPPSGWIELSTCCQHGDTGSVRHNTRKGEGC